jgi:hypothetical protein
LKLTPIDPLTMAAMLEVPSGLVTVTESNSRPSIVTGCVTDVTVSATPGTPGATIACGPPAAVQPPPPSALGQVSPP